jgi:hypothetical protein
MLEIDDTTRLSQQPQFSKKMSNWEQAAELVIVQYGWIRILLRPSGNNHLNKTLEEVSWYNVERPLRPRRNQGSLRD